MEVRVDCETQPAPLTGEKRIPKMEAGGWHANIFSRRKGPRRVSGRKPKREMSVRFRRKISEEEKG